MLHHFLWLSKACMIQRLHITQLLLDKPESQLRRRKLTFGELQPGPCWGWVCAPGSASLAEVGCQAPASAACSTRVILQSCGASKRVAEGGEQLRWSAQNLLSRRNPCQCLPINKVALLPSALISFSPSQCAAVMMLRGEQRASVPPSSRRLEFLIHVLLCPGAGRQHSKQLFVSGAVRKELIQH